MNPSQLSRYFTGRAPVGPLVLEKILSVFPEDTRPALVRAYLLDQIPPGCRDQLSVQIGGTKPAKPTADGLSHLPHEARDALRFIGAKCHERPVLDLVLSLSRLLRRDAS